LLETVVETAKEVAREIPAKAVTTIKHAHPGEGKSDPGNELLD